MDTPPRTVDGDEERLCALVAAHLAPALRVGQPALLLARRSRLAGTEHHLAQRGVDVAAARASERLVFLDAEALAEVVAPGSEPDPAAFEAAVAAPMARLSAGTVAYGELADVLVAAGRPAAAEKIEDLWHALCLRHAVHLLCPLPVPNAGQRAKDEFLAMLGHELRNPLAPIQTALRILDTTLGDRAARERAVIARQVAHLVRLVDDLLDVSRITRGRIALDRWPAEIAAVVARAVDSAGPLLEQRQHHLEVDVPAGLWVDGDAARLAQVVSNLLTNAAKYTEPGGRVRVEGRAVGGEAHLSVTDTGIGLDPDLRSRVFDVFVQGERTLERSLGGLGLGLAIVKSLVQMHGGSVVAESDGRGRGSRFVVRLPRLPENPELREPDTTVEIEARRILVVDDNVDAAEILGDALALSGHATRVAFDGPTALRLAEEFRPELVLLDIGLPVMDGYELAGRLKHLDGEVKLVALTGYGQPGDVQRSEAAGLDAHLVKPVQIDEIERVIGGLLTAG